MKRYILFIISILLIAAPTNAISISLGQQAPDFSLGSASGEPVSLSKFKGKTLVFIYWRTEQKRSVMALKEASEIMKDYEQKGVTVVGVIEDNDNVEEAQKVFADNKIDYPLLIDSNRQVYSDYGIRVFPTTVIVDKEGVLGILFDLFLLLSLNHDAAYRLRSRISYKYPALCTQGFFHLLEYLHQLRD